MVKIFILAALLFIVSCASNGGRNSDDIFQEIMGGWFIAANYIGEQNAFIESMADRCRYFLGKNKPYADELTSRWVNNNSQYVDAGKAHLSFVAFASAKDPDADPASELWIYEGAANSRAMIKRIKSSGSSKAKNLLMGKRDDNLVTCKKFVRDITAGAYDITSDSPYYSQLVELEEAENES